MRTHRLMLDANLLVLFVVGRTSPHLIGRHRRVRAFSADDYDLLTRVMGAAKQIVVTPNTLTETSNLLGDMHGRFAAELRSIIEQSAELSVASADAAHIPVFHRLGLTDAVLWELASAEMPLLTVDLDLFVAASSKSPNAAVNFRHLAEQGA